MTAPKRIYIDIIGTGNVATHLHKAFSAVREIADVVMINPHTFEGKRSKVDYTLIAVKDDAIPEIAKKIQHFNCGIVAHTSGSTSLATLVNAHAESHAAPDLNRIATKTETGISGYGVFYPLQTFSKNVDLNYSEIPIFIEGSDKTSEAYLLNLASLISDKVLRADSHQRRILHIAGVFACNFTNHLIGISQEILEANNLQLESLKPLVNETLRKAFLSDNPYKLQTGPAVRGDESTMNAHLELLDSFPEMKNVYKTLSNSIIEKHVSD